MTNHAHCLGQTGLAVFAATADQRYLLGPDVFIRTHFPVTLRHFHNGRSSETIGEDDLLSRLLAPVPASQGNRVFVLYGAAGSGKSELLRWLQNRLQQAAPSRARSTVRIARTELDALAISEKFRQILSDGYFNEVTHRRWQMARRKPRTLTKLIVLSALESLLDDDEAINALFYRLTNAIQPHIAHCLGEANLPGAVDILSRESWEEVMDETVLPVPVEYEVLRHQMLVSLQSHLLEGLNLPRTLRLISEHVVNTHNLRPILLVDDLVQSLNLFATDLLDYFVTLESGQWDVVLGLTPAAFEATQRGRELLQRIAYLDTLDDRVTKLWLSDDAGSESFFLNEGNCHEFAARYLAEHRRLNATAREATNHSGTCLTIDGDSSLCPFNRELLVRIFRNLPAGKGKARYFLNALHSVLEQAATGIPLLVALDGMTKVDGAARSADAQMARIGELYGPTVTKSGSITLSKDVVRFFKLGNAPVTLEVEPLTRKRVVRSAVTEVVDDEEKIAIRDWLLGRPVNRQLLKGVRRGTARWLRAVTAPDLLYRDGIARPHGVLRWRKTYLGTYPPICLEEVDKAEGIPLGREIGSVAFDLHRYAKAKGAESKQMLTQLTAEPRLLPVLLASVDARQKAMTKLESQLGMSLEVLTLCLYLLLDVLSESKVERLPGFQTILEQNKEKHTVGVTESESLLEEETIQSIEFLLEDWFKLRDNVWHGHRLAELGSGLDTKGLLSRLTKLDPSRLDKDYWLGKRRLSEIIDEAILRTNQVLGKANEPGITLSPKSETLLIKLQLGGCAGLPLSCVSSESLDELRTIKSDIYERLWITYKE